MKTCLALIAILSSTAAAFAEDVAFKPLAGGDGSFNTESNTGEWLRPDLGKASDLRPLKTRISATKESVTGGVAMKIVYEKDSRGVLAFEKGGIDPGTAGITFFAKASKPIHFRVCTDARQDKNKVLDIGTEWKKYDVAWSDLQTTDMWQLVFQVLDPITEKTTLILDRIGTEAPTFSTAPAIEPKAGPDDTISSKDILYGAENLAKILAQLKKKQPFKVAAIGDSISAGAQTSRGTWGVKIEDGVPFRYFGQLAWVLEQEFAYTGITPVVVGHGGWTTKMLIGVVDAEFLPLVGPGDLAVLQSGGNDIMNGSTVEQWKTDMKALIAKVRTKTDQILVVDTTVTASGPVLAQAEGLTRVLKELVAEEKVAGADVTRLFTFRGPAFACALLANDYHPDYMGHMIIGSMIAPILTGKQITYPE
ncbi:MAG: SGNH/GDSL hydrolase family protein [Planctomycetes bacterium]|nr:SGNH/GDSL hydrolase family protein [Planctomycetota bacterium]